MRVRSMSFVILVVAVTFVCIIQMFSWRKNARLSNRTVPNNIDNNINNNNNNNNNIINNNNNEQDNLSFPLQITHAPEAQHLSFMDDYRDSGNVEARKRKKDDGSVPLCERDQIVQGQWVPHQMPKPPYVTPTVHLRCYPHDFYYKDEPWDTWKWQPEDEAKNECQLQDWSRDTFCDLMRGATVSIVGDSLSWEHYSSLVQLNGIRTRQGYQHQSLEFHINIVQSVCDGHTRLIYRRDDRLENVTASIQSEFPTVLVLNRGAHFVNDTILLPEIRQNIEEVKEWLDTCRTKYKMKCHFFWRTSVPGHPLCGEFTQPVNDLALLEARVADLSMYNNRSINFHWYDYQHQNELILQELEKSGIEYQVIDAYYLNMRRPDEHRAHQDDCLHNCYPGKMDVYSQLMLHYVSSSRTRHDVKRAETVAAKNQWVFNETTLYDPSASLKAASRRKHRDG